MPISAPHPRTYYTNISNLVPSQQFVGKTGSAVNGQFEIGRSTWTEQWAFNGANIQSIVDEVIGYPSVGGLPEDINTAQTNPPAEEIIINRALPAYSNTFDTMYATGITNVEALAPTGEQDGIATYKQMRVTIQFETPPYDILTNNQVLSRRTTGKPPECWRYCVWNREPCNEFARTPRDAFRYPSGQFPAGHSPITGSGGQLYLITKYRITCNWLQVPQQWISSDGLTFGNMDDLVGTVNDASFLGYPKGTILFESYRPVPKTMPVTPGLVGVNTGGQIPRCYDVELRFLYFNPSPVFNAAGENPAPKGHNLVYEPRSGQWMRAIKIGALAAQEQTDTYWLYRQRRLDNVFEKVGTGNQVTTP